jgi:hypothetical protein
MRRLVLPLLLVVAVAAYVGHWFWVAGRVPGEIAAWAHGLRARGYDVAYGSVDVGGFPLKLDIAVADVEVAGALGHLGWRWSGPRVTALARPWRFDRLLLSLPPVHDLVLDQAGREHRIAIAQDSGQIAVVAEDGRIAALGLDAVGLRLADEAGSVIAATALKLRFEAKDDEATGDSLGVQVERLVLPAAPAAFPAEIASFTAVASLSGAIPPGPVRHAVAAWRDAGGTVEVPRFHLVWGTLDVEGDGTLSLDSLLRPIAAWRMRVAGYAGALQAAAARGAMDPAEAVAVRAALDLAAKPDEAGGPPRAEVAVTIQDGTVYVGPIAVGDVAPLPLP